MNHLLINCLQLLLLLLLLLFLLLVQLLVSLLLLVQLSPENSPDKEEEETSCTDWRSRLKTHRETMNHLKLWIRTMTDGAELCHCSIDQLSSGLPQIWMS